LVASSTVLVSLLEVTAGFSKDFSEVTTHLGRGSTDW
jgi:hypothetical protein